MKEVVFYTDRTLSIRSWGGKIAEFTGKSPEIVIGRKYYEILPRIIIDNKDALSEAIKKKKKISSKKYTFNCLYSQMKADIKINPIQSAEGKIARVRVGLYPYSSCALAQKLDQSQRLIDIGKIASTLAHGVRNPLNAIKGAVVYLGEKYSAEQPLIEFTQIMAEEISRLENFISRFLSSSCSALEQAPTNVNRLLKKIEVFTSLQAYTHNINPVYDLSDVPMITINAFHLEQAVLNVINNAIEAMEIEGRLTVRTFTEIREYVQNVVIEVSDTGLGMQHQNPGDMSPTKGDKGFGLYLTYEILKYYGGHLEITSRKNIGTTVRLYMPVK